MSSGFWIKPSDEQNVIDSIKNLVKRNKDLAWIDNKKVLNANTVTQILKEFYWDYDPIEHTVELIGEKLGDDYVLFSTIAPYVVSGSYIELLGEDGTRWKWVFENGLMKELIAKISYDE